MATLTVTGVRSHDYSTDVLSNIDEIKFHTTKSPTMKLHTARFSAAQFDNVQISTAVNITGDQNHNHDRVVIFGATNFSASAWTFTNFDTFDHFGWLEIGGTDGNDTITGSSVTDIIRGSGGDDVLDGGVGGNDLVSYLFDGAVTVSLAIAGPQDTGGAGTDTLSNFEGLEGSQTGDTLTGDDFANSLLGRGGADTVIGGGGSDSLLGGPGKDTLTGGLGADTFDFNLKSESPKGKNHDIITDFSGVGLEGDHINVHDIDANTQVGGNQNFHFIGAQKFHHHAGELHFVAHGTFVTVEGDTNGDGKADFQIEVHNVAETLNSLAKGDFVL
jgi:Ca2+-binding RTX toxin-like protein